MLDSKDVETGMAKAVEMLNKTSKVQMDIEDEPMYIKRLSAKFKTKKGNDCHIIIYAGVLDNVKDSRIIMRGVKNLAILREIPFDDLEDSIRGPGIKRA